MTGGARRMTAREQVLFEMSRIAAKHNCVARINWDTKQIAIDGLNEDALEAFDEINNTFSGGSWLYLLQTAESEVNDVSD